MTTDIMAPRSLYSCVTLIGPRSDVANYIGPYSSLDSYISKDVTKIIMSKQRSAADGGHLVELHGQGVECKR